MQRHFGVVQDPNGRAVANATVTVYTSGVANPLPVIYQTTGSKTAPAVQDNPMTTDALGNYGFAAPDGTYDIVISGGGIPTKTLPNIDLFDGGITYPSPMLGTVTSVSFSAPAMFSVGGSPVTGSGTIVLGLATQVTNTIFSGPASGADAAPTFRSLVANDLPNAGTAGTYGAGNAIPVITTDAKGRVTTVTTAAPAPAWGAITGTLSAQTDLQTALDGKASVGSVSVYTGDVRWTISPTVQSGWLLANGGTIGDASSSSSERADADTQTLWELIWNSTNINDCPMYTSAGVPQAKGGSAAADYALHYRIALPDMIGRTVVGAGTGTWAATFAADAGTDVITLSRSYKNLQTGTPLALTNSGGALPAGLSATTYYVIRATDSSCKLATSLANAIAGTFVDITGAGTGTHTATMTLAARISGELGGEENHGSTIAETPAHTHTVPSLVSGGGGTMAILPQSSASAGAFATSSSGSSSAHNNMQPYCGLYPFIKL